MFANRGARLAKHRIYFYFFVDLVVTGNKINASSQNCLVVREYSPHVYCDRLKCSLAYFR